MGHWAQNRKRGGNSGTNLGLPAAPPLSFFLLQVLGQEASAECLVASFGGYSFWQARFRYPAESMDWTTSEDGLVFISVGALHAYPNAVLGGETLECQVCCCDSEGVPLTLWSLSHTLLT